MTTVPLAHSLATCGVLALAYVLGARAIRSADELSSVPLARAVVAFVTGAALLTPPLVLIAALGCLRIPILGAVAWLLVAIALIRRLRSGLTWRSPTVSEVVIVVAAGAFAFVAVGSRDETLGAGRDQQVYAEFGIALAAHGSPEVRYASADPVDQALLRSGYSEAACHARFIDRWSVAPLSHTPFVVPGGTNACDGIDDPIKLLHPWGWPVWLSIAYEIAGVEGMLSANAIVFALGAVLFFTLARLLVDVPLAVSATIALLLLPSSLWIAGISLSEPLAMTFILGVVILAAIEPGHRKWLVSAVSLAAMAVRIDAAVVIPATMAAALASAAGDSTVLRERTRFALAQLCALIAAGGLYVVVFPSYLDVFWSRFLAVLAVSVALAGTMWLLSSNAAVRLDRILRWQTFRGALVGVMLLLFLYAATIRPALRESADARQLSLLNLAANLSWPVLLGAVGGVSMAIWRGWANRSSIRYPLAVVLALSTGVTLLAVPEVSPDQPWGFRRFLPVVVPCSILFAALFLQALRRRKTPWISRGLFGLVSLAFALAVIVLPRGGALLRENDGYLQQLDLIAKALPERLTLATAAQMDAASALLVAYGKPVATSEGGFDSGTAGAAITRWIAGRLAEGHPPTLLHGPELRESGLELTDERTWTLRRRFVLPQPRAPANTIGAETRVVSLTRVDGFDRTYATRMFGYERAWGSTEGGFLEPEITGFGMLRYTDGNAWIDIPTESLRDRVTLKIDLFTAARGPIRRGVSIMIDGRAVWKGDVATGVSTIRVPVVELPTRTTVRIGIVSDRVDTGYRSAGDLGRRLGVGVLGIRPLGPGEPHENGPSMAAFKAELVALGAIPDPIVIGRGRDAAINVEVRNAGSAYWPSYREHPDPRGVVKLALRWYDLGSSRQPVSEGRWPLAVSMLGGDRTRIRVPIMTSVVGAKVLAPGRYVLKIGMVREGVAMFPDPGSSELSLDVRVVRDTNS